MKKDERPLLKDKFLEYYSKMPIKKYAGYYICRDEDTILRWEKEDVDFADRVKKTKSEYLLSKARSLQANFIIPLLFRELTPRTEVTGADGAKLEGLVIIKDGSKLK